MTDVSPIQGPSAPQEPGPAKKQERTADADKFQKEMHKRVEKVSETDEEQKKSRKRREEAEEEEEPKEVEQAPPPPGQFISSESPMQMQGKPGISPLASARPSMIPGAPPPVAPSPLISPSLEMQDDSALLEESDFTPAAPETPSSFMSAPSYNPMQEDSGFYEQSSYIESVSSQEIPSSTPSYQTSTPSYSEPSSSTTQHASDQSPKTEVQSSSNTKEKDSSSSDSDSTTTPAMPSFKLKKPKKGIVAPEKAIPPSPQLSKKENPEGTEKKEGTFASELEKIKEGWGNEETGGLFEHLVDKEKTRKIEAKPITSGKEDKAESDEGAIAPIGSPLPSNPIEKEKKEKAEAAEIAAMGGMGMPPAAPGAHLPTSFIKGVTSNNPYASLHPHVMELFEKMVGVITVMATSGIKETVVTLNMPKFASSVFFGSQIIIQEYTSAPQAFNIQINGSPEALNFLHGNVDDLMAAFQFGNYNFRVNRLEAGLLAQKPLVRRKQSASGDNQDQKGSKQ